MSLPNQTTTLQDVLEEVPQLLEACASLWIEESPDLGYRPGFRSLRLVCKHTSQLTLRAVRSYRLTVSPQPSATEALLGVARQLNSAHLEHLHLAIIAPSGG